jgi:hypothetical protein
MRLLASVALMMLSTAASISTPAPPQGPFSLADLTVPSEQLPSGCTLSPSPTLRSGDNQVRTGLWTGLPISSNPWTGSDRAIVVAIHERVIDPPPIADGPPPTKRELAQFRLRLADGVEEAYAAIYTDDASHIITVNAVRYTDAPPPSFSRNAARDRPGNLRLTLDRTVLGVSGNEGACFLAIAARVRDLAGR